MPAQVFDTPGPDRVMPEPDEPEGPPEESHQAKIELGPQHSTPFCLFQDWIKDARKHDLHILHYNTFTLGTVTSSGAANCRKITLKEFKNNMFIFTVSAYSQTVQDFCVSRNVTALFYLQYQHYKSLYVRQIKIEGKVKKLCTGLTQSYYEKESLNSKIKYDICKSGQMVDWADQKKRHDKKLIRAKYAKEQFEMPDHYVGYALVPDKFEFWHTEPDYICDRIVYTKNCDCGWNIRRIAA